MTSAEARDIHDTILKMAVDIAVLKTQFGAEIKSRRRWSGVLPNIMSAVISGVVVGTILLLSGIGQ